jgi:mRNA-degrading endonuclease toxin of MazEF toxin-antitoxin module
LREWAGAGWWNRAALDWLSIHTNCVPPYPTEVLVESVEAGLSIPSAILLNQIRSIHRKSLIRRIGSASAAMMERVDQAILISLGLTTL